MRKLPLIATLLMAGPALAASEAVCERVFAAMDHDRDGTLDAAEGQRYLAALRVKGKSVTTEKLSKATFVGYCKADLFVRATPASDAPKAGATSLSESDARDRIVAEGFTEVSSLKKDDNGIWKGTGVWKSRKIGVVVDYRGNVVGQWGDLANR